MRTVLVVCFVLGVVSSLPIRTEEEPALPIPPEIPEEPSLPELPEDGIEVDPGFPISPELPIPDVPEDGIDGIEPDLPIQPEMPTVPKPPEDGVEGVEPDLPVQPEIPLPLPEDDINGIEPDLPIQPELPEDVIESYLDITILPVSTEEETILPQPPEVPIMIEYDITEGNNITMRNQIRPGMQITNYAVELEPNQGSGTFTGRLTVTVVINDPATLEDEIMFHAVDLDIQSVTFSIAGGSVVNSADFDVDDGILEIATGVEMSMYTFFIDYTGSISNLGTGFWMGEFDTTNYMAMNLHATNARRVFPCMDEATEPSTISFTFNNLPYNNIFMNSGMEDDSVNQFRALQGPTMLWGMIAHNFNNINNPTTNVQLFARQGLSAQENQASVAINFYFNNMELWTQKPYTEIVLDQDGRMLVIALPDVHKDWYALSTVCIWEPYVLMERIHSVKQRKEALNEIAEAITRQWYGYVIYPENWRFQWVVQGLSSYTAYELNREFQSSLIEDITLIDFNTVFVTDVIQEALYRDAYAVAQPLEPSDDIFEEDEINDHIYGLKILKYKSPAIMWMMKLILGNENQDFIQSAGQILLNSRSLETVNSRFFVDAINAEWLSTGNGIVEDLAEFIEPWVQQAGYPTVHVGLRQGGVLLTQEKFGYSSTNQANYEIPITWTTSIAPNYGADNIRPSVMMDSTMTINMVLDEEDYVLFNIQGQGYYRVNYDSALWERVIEALQDPEERERIHPLNRATLIDDALNLARAGMLDYDIAFQVVLSMEHEIDYAPWKAFVRNMDFLRKRLIAYVEDPDFEDDRDQDIYLRMVRRTVGRVESEIGFYPDILATEDSMVALTRGLVMDHACKAGYRPCIAAAVDWFWDPDNRDVVNPNIPHEIRPAVYCTMVREGGNDIISALYARLEIEPMMYERVVILESLGCSQDMGFIMTLLAETLATNGPYSAEERNRIFKAVVEGGYDNAFMAVTFIAQRTADMRRMYGGDEKLQDIIWHLAENMADFTHSLEFQIWANSIHSDLDASELAAQRARLLIEENTVWINAHLDYVYEWIDENDAPRLYVSLFLIIGSFLLTIFNR